MDGCLFASIHFHFFTPRAKTCKKRHHPLSFRRNRRRNTIFPLLPTLKPPPKQKRHRHKNREAERQIRPQIEIRTPLITLQKKSQCNGKNTHHHNNRSNNRRNFHNSKSGLKINESLAIKSTSGRKIVLTSC